MRNIREVLRLKRVVGLNHREISRSLGLGRSTISDYLKRAERAGLTWPLPLNMSDVDLEARLFPGSPAPSCEPRPLPDFVHIERERRLHRNINLTLDQLWREYRERFPEEGYEYSRFCELYGEWKGKRGCTMRQDHKAGEKLFVDYCDGLKITDPKTGEKIKTQLFVAAWGASSFAYAEASLSQELPCWIRAHVNAFEYFGSVPHLLVPDNLKSGVKKPCYYEPELNRTYAEMSGHYKTAVLPARPYKARDKAVVENAVLLAQRWILSVLRKRTFFSLAELNAAIWELLETYNNRPMRKIKKSRRELFEDLDRPAALPLPRDRYEYGEWIKPRVNIDYHIEAKKHYYSVPFQLTHERLEARVTMMTVEIFHKGRRVAAHQRSYVLYGHTTLPEHMPPEHQRHLEWTPSRIINWAGEKVGPCLAALLKKIMESRQHPQQGYRSCLGIMRLSKSYPKERMEAAAERALRYSGYSLKSMRLILSKGLDKKREEATADRQIDFPLHENIRGGEYYH